MYGRLAHALVFFIHPNLALATADATHQELDLGVAPSEMWQDYFSKNQNAITRPDFFRRINPLLSAPVSSVFTDHGDHVEILGPDKSNYKLEFSHPSRPTSYPSGKYWRAARDFLPDGPLPLSGLRVAIDPGHIGGNWSAVEGRLFIAPCGTVVAEGDMTLRVAKILRHLLVSAGATVYLTRKSSEPLMGGDSSVFEVRARENLRRSGKSVTRESVQRESTRIMLQQAEIEARAEIINTRLRPDLTICLHFNATPWGSRSHPKLVEENHFHALVGGHYQKAELEIPEQRVNLVRRVLEGTGLEEEALAKSIASELSIATRLPPFSYGDGSKIASPVRGSPYVWKRNLMATRLFHCPVVFLEPFVMNSREFVSAVRQATTSVRVSSAPADVFEQYAIGVYRGILRRYAKHQDSLSGMSDGYAPRWLDNR